MGEQYFFSTHFKWQIGLMIHYTGHSIILSVPFIDIHIATTKEAKGYNIFDIWSKYPTSLNDNKIEVNRCMYCNGPLHCSTYIYKGDVISCVDCALTLKKIKQQPYQD